MGEDHKILSAEQSALVTAPIDRARTLTREAFFDAPCFAAEIERPLGDEFHSPFTPLVVRDLCEN